MAPHVRIDHFSLLKSQQWCPVWRSIIFVQRKLSTTDSIIIILYFFGGVSISIGCFFCLSLLIVRGQQAEMVVVWRLVQGRDGACGGGWAWVARSWAHGRRGDGTFVLMAALPTNLSFVKTGKNQI